MCEAPWMSWMGVDGAAAAIATEYELVLVRGWSSVTRHCPTRSPEAAIGTVKRRLNVRSPALASPFVPSSKSGAVEPSPAQVRSQLTSRPVLVGFIPGVATARIVTCVPASGLAGENDTSIAGRLQSRARDAELRGAGPRTTKSAALSSVS